MKTIKNILGAAAIGLLTVLLQARPAMAEQYIVAPFPEITEAPDNAATQENAEAEAATRLPGSWEQDIEAQENALPGQNAASSGAYTATDSEALRRLRALISNNGKMFGIAGIGYWSYDETRLFSELMGRHTFAYADVYKEIAQYGIHDHGTTVFCIIPANRSTSMRIRESAGLSEEGEALLGDTLYRGEPGEPMILSLEDYDILSNVFVEITGPDGQNVLLRPGYTLDGSGKIYCPAEGYDFTEYAALGIETNDDHGEPYTEPSGQTHPEPAPASGTVSYENTSENASSESASSESYEGDVSIEYTGTEYIGSTVILNAEVHNDYGSYVHDIGIVVWDGNGDIVREYQEECLYPDHTFRMWYDLEDELGFTPRRGVPYYYQFFVKYDETELWGDTRTFTRPE